MIEDILDTSDELIRVCARLPNRRVAAAALAIALGRVCSGADLDAAVDLARIAGEPDEDAAPRLITAAVQLRGEAP